MLLSLFIVSAFLLVVCEVAEEQKELRECHGFDWELRLLIERWLSDCCSNIIILQLLF
jgi:hypothetical protein